jgi:hypothetical protein
MKSFDSALINGTRVWSNTYQEMRERETESEGERVTERGPGRVRDLLDGDEFTSIFLQECGESLEQWNHSSDGGKSLALITETNNQIYIATGEARQGGGQKASSRDQNLPLLGRPEAHEPNTSNRANGQIVATQVLMDSISPSSAGRRLAWIPFQWCQYFKI